MRLEREKRKGLQGVAGGCRGLEEGQGGSCGRVEEDVVEGLRRRSSASAWGALVTALIGIRRLKAAVENGREWSGRCLHL